MKILTLILVLVGSSALAFDSETWLGKREVFGREAERLRSAYQDCAKQVTAPAENITIPVESYPDGSVKSSVFAAKAQLFLDTGLVWGDGVVVRTFDPAGVVQGEFKAERCLIDRTARSGWIEGRAEIKYQDYELTGEQIYFSFADEFVKIFARTKVRSKNLKVKGLATAADAYSTREAVMTATHGDYDHRQGVLLFEGDVRIDDPEYHLQSDRLFAFLDGTNEVKRIVALGSVSASNGLRRAYCDQALYAKGENRVVLFGEPARLMELGERKGELSGARISFGLTSGQVEVERSTITVEGAFKDNGLGKVLEQ